MFKRLMTGLALSALTCGMLASAEGTKPDWAASPFGPDDRLGAINYLTPEKTADAAKLITTGKSYSLGMVTSRETPTLGSRSFDIYVLPGGNGSGSATSANKLTSNDDMVVTFNGIGSQIDGLGHIGIEHFHYNGVHVSDFVSQSGLTQFGTDALPAIATRGILLDMTKIYGASPIPDGTAFNRAEIETALENAGVTLEQGDIVIFHTGKMAALADGSSPSRHAGLGVEGAAYLAEQGVVAIGSDTFCVEVVPFETRGMVYPVHQELLTKHGVYILENMVTHELAADNVTEFFFSLGIPRLKGSVQSIINPVAIR